MFTSEMILNLLARNDKVICFVGNVIAAFKNHR